MLLIPFRVFCDRHQVPGRRRPPDDRGPRPPLGRVFQSLGVSRKVIDIVVREDEHDRRPNLAKQVNRPHRAKVGAGNPFGQPH